MAEPIPEASGARITASDVIPMFPTLVWKLQLEREFHEAVDAKILAAIATMRGGELGPGQGWQSEHTLHEREELRELVASIRQAARSVLRFLRIGYEAVEITGCWANVLATGAAHKAHCHPNNFLSGAYYVRTHPGGDTINFHDPRAQASVIRPPVLELTSENTDQVVVKVQNGTLLLFPAYLPHSVDANTSEAERISLSFNLMFSSFTETLSKPLW
jgi:uncharacterized protein (TIGR02466 family)